MDKSADLSLNFSSNNMNEENRQIDRIIIVPQNTHSLTPHT